MMCFHRENGIPHRVGSHRIGRIPLTVQYSQNYGIPLNFKLKDIKKRIIKVFEGLPKFLRGKH